MPQNNIFLKHAPLYAKRGFAVLPLHGIVDGKCTCNHSNCTSQGKHPRINGGVNNASKEPVQLEKWSNQWSNSNIGLATGAKSGFFVVDVDKQHDGDKTLDDLIDIHGKLPDTPEVITGNGGSHLLFKMPNDSVKSGANILGHGIDIRGDGGYIVAAPSNHISGRPYEWEESSGLDQVEFAEAPKWLFNKLKRYTKKPENNENQDNNTTKIYEGGRDEYLTRIAGTLRRVGLSKSSLNLALQNHNEERCEPPLTSVQVSKIAQSISNYATSEDCILTSPSTVTFYNEFDKSKNIKHTKYLIKKLLQPNTITLFIGHSGAKKSFNVVDWCMCISSGTPYHGMDVNQGNVVMILGEGNSSMSTRTKAWRIKNSIETKLPLIISDHPIMLMDEQSLKETQKSINHYFGDDHPVLIVVDTISANFGNGEENSNSDVAGVMANVKRYLQLPFNACVVLVHHLGHNVNNRARGASAFGSNADCVILVKETNNAITLSSEKVKDGEPFSPISFSTESIVVLDGDEENEPLTSLVLNKIASPQYSRKKTTGSNKSKITDALRTLQSKKISSNPDNNFGDFSFSKKEIREQTGLANNRFDESLKPLLADNEVLTKGDEYYLP